MGIRLTTSFRNLQNKLYQVDIHDVDFVGASTEYISGKAGFNLSYQTAGDDYLTTAIIGSSVELPIHLRDDNRTEIESFLNDLISSDEDRFLVLIYENGNIYWRGKIQVEQVQIPDRFYTEISIFAADGLGRLDSITYSNGELFYYDYATFQTHLHNIISKLGLYQFGIENELGIVQDWTVDGISGRFPESIQMHHDAFKEIKGTETLAFSCLDVLKQLLYRFQLRIVQQDGIFFVQQIGYLTGTGNKTCHYYTSDGNFAATTSGTSFNTTITQKLAGGLSFYREPAKSVQVKYAFKNGISSNIFSGGPLAYNTPFVDGLIPNENGEVLGISFDFLLQNTPPGSYTPNIFYFVQFIFTVKIGAYYLNNDNGVFTWTTTNTDRVILYSRQIDVNETGQFIAAVGFLAPVCPVSDIFTFTWNTDNVDLDYVTYPAANVSVSISRQDAQIVYGINEPNEGTNSTTASSGNKSGEKIELPVLITGDKPFGASIGRIQKYDGTDWKNTFGDWGFNTNESLNIDELLSRETMALQKTSVVMQSLTLLTDVNVANKISENIIMSASYVANQNQWTLECFTPVIDRTGIAYANFTESDGIGSVPGGITTTPPGTTTQNYWKRTGTVLSPTTGGDNVEIDVTGNVIGVDSASVDGSAIKGVSSGTGNGGEFVSSVIAVNASSTGTAVQGYSSNIAIHGIGTGTNAIALRGSIINTHANSVTPLVLLQKNTSGTLAAGIGLSIDSYIQSSSSTPLVGRLSTIMTNITNATMSSDFAWLLRNAGAALAQVMRLTGAGQLQMIESRTGDATNNVSIGSTGIIRLNGTATVVDDARCPLGIGNFGPGASNRPTQAVWLGGLVTLSFDRSTMNEAFFECQLPHGYKAGSNIVPHVHFRPLASPATATRVRWGLEYVWQNMGEAAPVAATTIYTDAVTPNETMIGFKHYTSYFAAITGTGKEYSSIISGRLFRDAANAADTFVGEAGVMEIDFHFEMDKIGSDE